MEKLIKDGKVAILISPGYGVGWSTWKGNPEFLRFDKGLVEMALEKVSENEVREYLDAKGINAYTDAWQDIIVEWLPIGAEYAVLNYDGSEFIIRIDDMDTITED